MKDVTSDSFRILAVADINGAKKYMYDDGLIGLAHYLKNLPDSDKPNMFVINGGLLPEVPVKGGPRNDDRQRVLVDGVVDLSGAAAVVKPHMQRIFSALPETTDIIYVRGASDQINIDNLKSYYNGLYISAKKMLAKPGDVNLFGLMKKEISAGITSKENMGNAMRESLGLLEEKLALASTKEEKDKISVEIKKIGTNIKLHREEIQELHDKRVLLGKLEILLKTTVDPEVWEKKIATEQKKLNKATKKLEMLRVSGKGTEEYEKLSGEAKKISNRLRQLGHRLNESIERSGVNERDARLGSINQHNGRIPVPPDVNDILTKLVALEYAGNIKDALGRKRNVKVQEGKIETYTKSVSGYTFNVLLADSMNLQTAGQTYIRGSNSKFANSVYALLNNNGSISAIERSDTVVAISGGHGFTSFSIEPLRDQSGTKAYFLARGPLVDGEAVAAFWNRGVKTKETVAAQQGILDSGVSMVEVFKDGQINHTTIKPGMLHDQRIASDREEAKKLAETIVMVNKGKGKALGAENPELAEAIIRSKRPSEILSEEMPFAREQLVRSLVPNVDAPVPSEPKEVKITVIADVHTGAYGDLDLFKAAVNDALLRKPNVLALVGDNIEGNLRNHKHEPRPENEYGVIDKFKDWLINTKGLDELTVLRTVEDRRRKQATYEITNIDEQGKIFVDILAPLAVDVIKRGDYIYIISGNHYNGTQNDSQRDEATVISGAIKLLLAGYASELPKNWEEQISVVRGGKYNADTFKIGDMNIELRHALAPSPEGMIGAEERKRSDSGLVLTGHFHETKAAYRGDMDIVECATMQLPSTFVKALSVPIEEKHLYMGYANINVKIKDGKLVESTLEPRLREQLGAVDQLWTEFQASTKSKEMPKEKAVRVRA